MNPNQARKQIREFADQGALFFINHSGGKDSQAMAALLKNLVPADQLVIIHAELPGMDWDGSLEFIQENSFGLPVHTIAAQKTFFEMVERRGMFPSPAQRQCTSDLKRDPLAKLIRRIAKERGQDLIINCMGIRADESAARAKKNPLKLNNRLSKAGRTVYDFYPIFTWSTDQVFGYIKANGQEPFWTYQEGMERKSCVFCIMACKSDQEIAARLRPDLAQQVMELEEKIDHSMSMDRKFLREILSESDDPDVRAIAKSTPGNLADVDQENHMDGLGFIPETARRADGRRKTLLSLFDASGVWSQPYKDAGWIVLQRDLQHGHDIWQDFADLMFEHAEGSYLDGILAAVPCTDFAGSGARWWADKDKEPPPYHKDAVFERRLDYFTDMVVMVQTLAEEFNVDFWAIENPVGRIHKVVPDLGPAKMYFNPCDFGHPYTKKTGLWGEFNTDLPRNPVEPTEGSKMWAKYGGKSARTKRLRSVTPKGFADAFFKANH